MTKPLLPGSWPRLYIVHALAGVVPLVLAALVSWPVVRRIVSSKRRARRGVIVAKAVAGVVTALVMPWVGEAWTRIPGVVTENPIGVLVVRHKLSPWAAGFLGLSALVVMTTVEALVLRVGFRGRLSRGRVVLLALANVVGFVAAGVWWLVLGG